MTESNFVKKLEQKLSYLRGFAEADRMLFTAVRYVEHSVDFVLRAMAICFVPM